MQQTDVSAATVTATGVAVNQPARIKAIYLVSAAVAGSLVFRNGGSAGNQLITIDTPAGIGDISIPVPDNGVRFSTNVHITISNVTSVTVFYA